jgi:alpha-ketoglutarate-dependent taurine dioxygenase
LIRHVLDYLRMPGYPEMMAIGNTETKDKDEGVRNGAAVWHTDGSYIEDPTTVTMLHARRVPRTGGETMIADMVRAYEALDPALRVEVDQMTALHYYGRAQFDPDEHVPTPIKTGAQATANAVCEKPLVLTHPVSGHRALYAVAHSPFRINGMTEAKSRRFLARLKAHATAPRFVHAHRYAVGDILIFDTLSTMHRAKHQTDAADNPDADNARLLWRLSAKGLPKVHRG